MTERTTLQWIATAVLIALIGLCVHRADAADVGATVTWTPPSTRVDDSPLPAAEIASYELVYTRNGAAQPKVTLPPVPQSYAIVGAPGRYCVVMRTVDTDGLVSEPSAEVCRKATPRPPVVVIR